MSAATTEIALLADRAALLAQIREKLEGAGIPYHDVSVFGRINLNVHVRCISHNTARRWGRFLATALGKGTQVRIVSTLWLAADQSGSTCLLRRQIRGYLIGAVAQ